uniref:NADH dehydrogenase [ubiquinone] 1 beta subcomplex subunit 10 n=1 Tax=Isotomurus palustris TaxID=36144 RepID=A0A481SWN6_9HEXA|nr:hypothetical protein [Isotomurus palustris]
MGDAKDYEINKHNHSVPRREFGSVETRDFVGRVTNGMFNMIDKPVTWFRETIVEPNRKQYPWYHQQFRRVPTIDQCYTDDKLCILEANEQFIRDRLVDSNILNILRYRMDDCFREEYPDYHKCLPYKEAYEEASGHWFAKYGDLGAYYNVEKAFMKQKHRLIWERRHGKVGCGMKSKDNEVAADPDEH